MMMRKATMAILAAALGMPTAALQASPSKSIPVTLAPIVQEPQSGRLLVFAKRVEPGAKLDEAIDASQFEPTGTAIAARDVWSWTAGQIAQVDAGVDAFPAAFATLPPGRYRFQAVLDRNDNYNFDGRGAGDVVSTVVEVTLPGTMPMLTLTTIVPAPTVEQRLMDFPDGKRAAVRRGLAQVRSVDFVSPVLTRFRSRPVSIRGWIALPPGYGAAGTTFPTVYSFGGYGTTLDGARISAANAVRRMAAGIRPPMIWVFLDAGSATGMHQFADSANNGPWGQALVTEFIPWIEAEYAMDGRVGSRFLSGHSSGGWTALWLQVRYSAMFGGSWPTSPDPSDFHDFANVDLYAAHANAYHDAAGRDVPTVRDKGKVVATFEQFARMERTLGPVGGQMASCDWVFSPKGADGLPQPMFDRATGAIDPAVIAYWRDHYDIAFIVARDWSTLRSDLDGKIRLYVGTADNFYLDGSARRLQAVFEKLGARQSFTFVPGRTHFDLVQQGKDRGGLMTAIAWDMYRVARPGSPLRRKTG